MKPGAEGAKPVGPPRGRGPKVEFKEGDLRTQRQKPREKPHKPRPEDLQRSARELEKIAPRGPQRGGILEGHRAAPHDTTLTIEGVRDPIPIRMIDQNWRDLRAQTEAEGWKLAGFERGSAIYAKDNDVEIVKNYLRRPPASAGSEPIGWRLLDKE